MFKILILVFLILALLVYSRITEEYQNFVYYPGYGGPLYSGVEVNNANEGAPYTGHGHGTGYGIPEPEYY
jgi:hypothetical protein